MADGSVDDETHDVYIATMGYLYPEDDNFYPPDLPIDEYLRYYASKFDSVLIRSTFYRTPRPDIYKNWVQSVRDNDAFKFMVCAPEKLTQRYHPFTTVKDIWNVFWYGPD